MKAERRKIYAVLILSIVLVLSLTGCKASKKKVLSSSYYKELKKENKKLKKENKRIKSTKAYKIWKKYIKIKKKLFK